MRRTSARSLGPRDRDRRHTLGDHHADPAGRRTAPRAQRAVGPCGRRAHRHRPRCGCCGHRGRTGQSLAGRGVHGERRDDPQRRLQRQPDLGRGVPGDAGRDRTDRADDGDPRRHGRDRRARGGRASRDRSDLRQLGIDHVVVVGDEAGAIATGARAAGTAEVSVVADGDGAAAVALAWLAPGDVVAIKGSRVAGLEQVACSAGRAAGHHMIAILIAGAVALLTALVGTPLVISYFRDRGFGQQIREEGPISHHAKAGTPTMGGTAIVLATVVAYVVAHLGATRVTPLGLLVLGTFVLMAVVGFADDLIKLRMRRNLGLNKTTKFLGQALIAALFAFVGPTYAGPAAEHLGRRRHRVRGQPLGVLPVDLPAADRRVERGQPHRRSGRSGGGIRRSGVRRVHAHRLLAVQELRGLRPRVGAVPRHRDHQRGAGGGLFRVPVAQRAARADLHGGHRLPGARWGAGRSGRGHQHAVAARAHRWAVRGRDPVGDRPGCGLPPDREARLPDGADPPPLRARGWQETTIIVRFWIIAGIGISLGLGLFYAEWIDRVGTIG
jgi:hypothetical protein